jgi:hypothetical protein
MSLKYKEGCTLVKNLTNKLDEIIINYSKSNRQEIKGICENIRKFRSSFDNTDDLHEIQQYFELTLNGLLKDEYAEFEKILKHYRIEEHLLELRENGGRVFVMTEDEYYGKAPCDISPTEEMRKQTTVGDIKRMLEEFPDDMIALGQCEGGIYNLPSFSTLSLDEDVLDAEQIIIPDDYEHKDMKGEKEFLFFE